MQKKLNDEFTGKQIIYIKADIGKLTELEQAFKQATDKFDGQLDVVINTAGIFNDKDVNATLTVNAVCTECNVRDRVRIELTICSFVQGGAINSTILAVKHMHKEAGGKGGVVVNISSVVGLDPLFLLPVYSASKEAIVAFTRAFSVRRAYTIPATNLYLKCLAGGLLF